LRRPKILLAAAFGLLVLSLGAAPAAQAISLGPPEPHSPNAETIRTTYWVVLIVSTLLMVAINAALIAAVVRFRSRRGREPARVTAARGALRAPVAGFAVLAIALFVFGVIQTGDARTVEAAGPDGLGGDQTAQVGIKDAPPPSLVTGQGTADEPPQANPAPTDTSPVQINAIAQQWLWRFEYPGHSPSTPLFSYGELVVPVDTPVILNITSTDVLHSWWVPALDGQVQASPGTSVQTWFKADEVGTYPGRSTIFSGSSYPAMRAWVRVVTVPEYQDYVEQLGNDITTAQGIVQQSQEEQTSPTHGGESGATNPEGSG
jgi:cytochrome c oxidase subunit 2